MTKNLLLISGSKTHGTGYLDHCENEIKETLEGRTKVLFIPYARPGGISYDEYTAIARKKFEQMGKSLKGIHEYNNHKDALADTVAIFIGGGNTFVLLTNLKRQETLIPDIYKAVHSGTPYIGASAGSNVAGKTIKTTNDMPIVHPPNLNALNLIPYNINPHYMDHDPNSKHQGESRDTRIKEFHAFNDTPVIALREGAMLRVTDDRIYLTGNTGAKIFKPNQEPKECNPKTYIDSLLR